VNALLREVLLLGVVGVSAPVVVRWLLPAVLRLLLEPLLDVIGFAAACLLLPEYLVSTVARRRTGAPPSIAYEYGALVAGAAGLVQRVLRRACRLLAVVAQNVPAAAAAAMAIGVHLAVLLGS
jgi:hypothetical protein